MTSEREKLRESRIVNLQNYIKNYLSTGETMKKKKKFYEQKTFWAAVTLAATAFAPQFLAMNPGQIDAARTLIIAAGAIFMRQGVENSK